MGTRPRDSYRARVYAAEAQLDHEELSSPEILDLINNVTRNVWFRNRQVGRLGSKNQFVIQHFNPHGAYCSPTLLRRAGDEGGVAAVKFRLTTGRMTDIHTYHTLAHLLHPDTTAWHGPEFAAVYIKLVEHELGEMVADDLRALFREHKVKTRTWSEASKAAARQKRQLQNLLAIHHDLSQ